MNDQLNHRFSVFVGLSFFIADVQRQLSFRNGMVVACPIPVPSDPLSVKAADMHDAMVKEAIDQALAESRFVPLFSLLFVC